VGRILHTHTNKTYAQTNTHTYIHAIKYLYKDKPTQVGCILHVFTRTNTHTYTYTHQGVIAKTTPWK